MDRPEDVLEKPGTLSYVPTPCTEMIPYPEFLNMSPTVSLSLHEATSHGQAVESVLWMFQHSKVSISLCQVQVKAIKQYWKLQKPLQRSKFKKFWKGMTGTGYALDLSVGLEEYFSLM